MVWSAAMGLSVIGVRSVQRGAAALRRFREIAGSTNITNAAWPVRGARTVIEEFARIKAADVVLPTTAGRDVRLACVTRPDKARAAIIERLGIELPERLGRPRWVPVPTEAEM